MRGRAPGRVRLVPPRQAHRIRIDLLHVDDVAVLGQIEITGLAAAENQDLPDRVLAASR